MNRPTPDICGPHPRRPPGSCSTAVAHHHATRNPSSQPCCPANQPARPGCRPGSHNNVFPCFTPACVAVAITEPPNSDTTTHSTQASTAGTCTTPHPATTTSLPPPSTNFQRQIAVSPPAEYEYLATVDEPPCVPHPIRRHDHTTPTSPLHGPNMPVTIHRVGFPRSPTLPMTVIGTVPYPDRCRGETIRQVVV